MIRRHNAWIRALGAMPLVVFVIGCNSPSRPNPAKPASLHESPPQTTPTARLGSQTVSDIPGRVIVGILTAVGEPAGDGQGQTIILVPDLINRSSAPDGGVIDLGTDLRTQLAQAGEASRIAFVDPAAFGSASRAHYILEGEAFMVQKNGQRYWEVFFTLYDVDPATGAKQDRRWEAVPGYLVPR